MFKAAKVIFFTHPGTDFLFAGRHRYFEKIRGTAQKNPPLFTAGGFSQKKTLLINVLIHLYYCLTTLIVVFSESVTTVKR